MSADEGRGGHRARNGRGRGRSREAGRGRLPRQDLGPGGTPGSWPTATPPRIGSDAYAVESVEIAGLFAERAVCPFLTERTEPRFSGVSAVELLFMDADVREAFRRTGSARLVRGTGKWYLIRRWAEADGDGGLDEKMCGAVAKYLNLDFAGRLRASVVTWIIDDRS